MTIKTPAPAPKKVSAPAPPHCVWKKNTINECKRIIYQLFHTAVQRIFRPKKLEIKHLFCLLFNSCCWVRIHKTGKWHVLIAAPAFAPAL